MRSLHVKGNPLADAPAILRNPCASVVGELSVHDSTRAFLLLKDPPYPSESPYIYLDAEAARTLGEWLIEFADMHPSLPKVGEWYRQTGGECAAEVIYVNATHVVLFAHKDGGSYTRRLEGFHLLWRRCGPLEVTK